MLYSWFDCKVYVPFQTSTFYLLWLCRWGKWFPNRTSSTHSPYHRRSNTSMLDVSNMGSGDHIVCSSGILESILFGYRQNALYISSVSAQIAVLPMGKLMAAYLPNKPIHIRGTQWFFSLNPGPFNLKEHVLITIFANSGSNTYGLCSELYYHCQGFLSPGNSSSGSHLVNSNHPGDHFSVRTCLTYWNSILLELLHYFFLIVFDGLFRCLGTDGLEFFESFLLIHLTCGGLPTWFKSLCLGAPSPSFCFPPHPLTPSSIVISYNNHIAVY